MWNVQCILAAHAALRLACLLLLFNRFFRRQWIFLLRFRFLQFRLIELLNLSHIGFVRHGCRGRGANCERVKSGLRCGRRRVPNGARRAQLYARSYANGVTSSARPLNSLAPGFVSGTASGACMALGGPRVHPCTKPRRGRQNKARKAPSPRRTSFVTYPPPLYVGSSCVDFCSGRENRPLGIRA